VVALAMSSCSSSSSSTAGDSPSSTTNSGGASSSAPATHGSFNIGVLVPEHGPFATGAAVLANECEGWAKYQDSLGGIAGESVNCIAGDTSAGAAAALASAQQLVQQDHVAIMLDDDATTDPAFTQYLVSQKIPTLGIHYLHTQPNFLQTKVDLPSVINMAATAAAGVGAKSTTYMYCAEAATCAAGPAILNTALAHYVISSPIPAGIKTPAAAASYTAECLAAKQANVGYVYMGLAAGTVMQVAQACSAQDYHPVLGLNDGTVVASELSGVTGTMAGGLSGFPWWVNAAPVEAFRAAFQKWVPGQDYRNDQVTTNWSQLQLIAYALNQAKPSQITPATALQAFYSMTPTTLDGLFASTIKFNPKGGVANPVPCFWLYKATNLNFQMVKLAGAPSGNGQTGALQSTCDPTEK
jgi:branched-chain amino acid transport system substrate-binding protein